jgi:tetratricopeptide (TPR) repeat protein
MRKLCALVAALAAGWASVATAADLDAALRALDRGDAAAARGPLAEEVARLSILQALAESGDARLAAAERAAAIAAPGSWAAAAAEALRAEAGGDLAAAAAAAGRAAELAPEDARLWHLLGTLLRRQGDHPGARGAFERARAARPDYPVALVALGDLLREDGAFTGAFNAYNHAVGVEGAPGGALLGRATARLYIGDEQGALQDLETAAAQSPPGVDRSRALMGILYLRTYLRQLPAGLDRAEEAARMWAELGAADEVAGVMNAAARVLLETGDAVSAEAWYQRSWQTVEGSAMPAAERAIWQVRSLHGQARCAAVRREIGRAVDLAGQAKALMDADPANADHYAWIRPYLDAYLALFDRRAEDAVPLLLASDTERPHIRLLLAQAYGRVRDNANARLWYERALAAAVDLDAESVIVRPQAAAWLERNR